MCKRWSESNQNVKVAYFVHKVCLHVSTWHVWSSLPMSSQPCCMVIQPDAASICNNCSIPTFSSLSCSFTDSGPLLGLLNSFKKQNKTWCKLYALIHRNQNQRGPAWLSAGFGSFQPATRHLVGADEAAAGYRLSHLLMPAPNFQDLCISRWEDTPGIPPAISTSYTYTGWQASVTFTIELLYGAIPARSFSRRKMQKRATDTWRCSYFNDLVGIFFTHNATYMALWITTMDMETRRHSSSNEIQVNSKSGKPINKKVGYKPKFPGPMWSLEGSLTVGQVLHVNASKEASHFTEEWSSEDTSLNMAEWM